MIEVDWKEFTNENDLPLNKKLLIKWKNESISIIFISNQIKSNNFLYMIENEKVNLLTEKILSDIKAWSTFEEKQKEKGSRVYLDFSESELEELQELLKLSKTKIEIMISDSKEETNRLKNNVKKFQDKFSKVEF